MACCPNPHVIPDAVVYRLADPSAPDGTRWTMHVRVFCVSCQTPYRFQGNNALAPVRLEEALMDGRGPWVSSNRDELGVVIAVEDEPGMVLSTMEPAGRA